MRNKKSKDKSGSARHANNDPLRDSHKSSSIIDMAAVSNIKDLDINDLEIGEQKSRQGQSMRNKTQVMQTITHKGMRGSGLSKKKSETVLPALMKPSDRLKEMTKRDKGTSFLTS